MIVLNNLTKKFGKKEAVKDLNLTINSGQITAFLGPNGAGKTTTIKMIVGLLRPTMGNISILGKSFSTDSKYLKKNISYIPDFPFLYERLTGIEFLEFICGINCVDRVIGDKLILENLEMFGLTGCQNELIKSYSHGMRQRLVFCSALIKEPEILIIDEPMVGLDPKTARIFKDLLVRLSSKGKTVFLSTHQLSVAEELAHRIVIINNGEIIKEGGKADLISNKFSTLEELFLNLTET